MNFLDCTEGRKLFEAAHREMSEALDCLPPAKNLLDDNVWFARLKLVSQVISEAGKVKEAE